ncbi:glycosyl hydrolase [Natrialbaceae archaeon A-arb3/5]
MKLQTIHDGDVLVTNERSLFRCKTDGSTTKLGRLPTPDSAGFAYRLQTTSPFRSAVTAVTGRFPAVNVWSITDETLLASAGRWVFHSDDGGRQWTVSHLLPDSSAPMGVLPTAVCSTGEEIYLGEYPLDNQTTPRVLRSTDGRTWSTVATLDGVRHVHSVQRDPYTDDIWVTTGDTDAESKIGRLQDGTLEVVGEGDQSWRAVKLAFTPSAVLWGVDSVYTDGKPIRKLPRERIDEPDPRPETVHEVTSSVYYAETLAVDGELWVLFSTSMEAGADSTGPETQTVRSDRAAVVAASSASDFSNWHELVSYEKRTTPADWMNGRAPVPTANAYVFLATHPDHGVILNPYNTARDDGKLRTIPPQLLADCSQKAGRGSTDSIDEAMSNSSETDRSNIADVP